ncbi:MAG: hypothetical protein WDW38_006616 [Sanguina aurantia]
MVMDDWVERRVYDDKSSGHSNTHVKPFTSVRTYSSFANDHPSVLTRSLRQEFTRQTPAQRTSSTALDHARTACQALGLESDDLPTNAVSFFLATRERPAQGPGEEKPGQCQGPVGRRQVAACTMVLTRRLSRVDIDVLCDLMGLESKTLSDAIEELVVKIHTTPKLHAKFGLLVQRPASTRFTTLIKQASEALLSHLGSEQEKEDFCDHMWGVKALAQDMLLHLQFCKVIGGNGLTDLARSILFLACQHHQLRLPPTAPKSFISKALFSTHAKVWNGVVGRWLNSGFQAHVERTKRMRECGSRWSLPLQPPAAAPVATAGTGGSKPTLLSVMRHTRALASQKIRSDPRYIKVLGTGTESGVVHLCVWVASHNSVIAAFMDVGGGDDAAPVAYERVGVLLEVCMSAVSKEGGIPDGLGPAHIVSSILATRNFWTEVGTARKFHTQTLPHPGCFMPLDLISWG